VGSGLCFYHTFCFKNVPLAQGRLSFFPPKACNLKACNMGFLFQARGTPFKSLMFIKVQIIRVLKSFHT
jgi:hypothetical protein